MVADSPVILRAVRDPRDGTARRDLGEMLFLAPCGEKTCADFASAHEAAFREVPTPHHGTPSHDTVSRTLRVDGTSSAGRAGAVGGRQGAAAGLRGRGEPDACDDG